MGLSRKSRWLTLALLLFTAGLATAQTPGPNEALPLSVGDEMIVLYYESLAMAAEPIEIKAVVDQQGYIFLPLVGEIEALGLTPKQLEDNLVEALGVYVETPIVSIRVTMQRDRAVFLVGAVVNQGAFQTADGTTLSQFIASNGGLRNDADFTNVRITRLDGEKVSVNLQAVMEGNTKKDVPVFPGDKIFVPQAGRDRFELAFRYAQFVSLVLQAAIFFVVLAG